LPVEQGGHHASTLFLCHAFGMHSEVHLLHVQGLCNMSTQLGGACRFCWTTRIHQARHTDYWRVVQLELQLQLFASCSGCCHMHRVRARRTHSQVHLQLPLGRPAQRKRRQTTTNLLSLNSSVA
jgi:hypothetical protein